MDQTTEADQAAARIEAFLPEFTDIPDETPHAQMGAAVLAVDIRTVFRHRQHLAERLARAEEALAERDAELAEAREDQEWLGYLNEAGIDNSPAYDYACELRRKARRATAVPSGTEEANEA